jgi:hypothetical protein
VMTKVRSLTALAVAGVVLAALWPALWPLVRDAGDRDEVTLTATWTKFKPENVTYSVDGVEQFVLLRTMKKTDTWTLTLPAHVGSTFSVSVYMGSPPVSGYLYGCSITRNGRDIATPRASVVPGGVQCSTT